jgi:ABC-type multidrug transport system fused ATPase/permease subunit
MIARFYDATDGEVLVDGVNVRDYRLFHLREGVGMVLQKNTLFSGSIRDNLRWGDDGASEDEIRAEAERMAVDDLLFELVKRTENISLSDNDKTEHFDRYVKKYVEDYGYDEEYVRKNLSSEVYDSMLYDKTTEFLIAYNYFE